MLIWIQVVIWVTWLLSVLILWASLWQMDQHNSDPMIRSVYGKATLNAQGTFLAWSITPFTVIWFSWNLFG